MEAEIVNIWDKVEKEKEEESARLKKHKNRVVELYVDLILTLIFILSTALYFDVEGILK